MADGIENFPESYQPYLEELKKKHPNWTFTALYTSLDWNYVIQNENIFGKNLVPKSYHDRWKNTNPGEYNVEVDAGWVDLYFSIYHDKISVLNLIMIDGKIQIQENTM